MSFVYLPAWRRHKRLFLSHKKRDRAEVLFLQAEPL